MKVSLRKANTIINTLQEEFKEIKFETTVKLSEFTDPAVTLAEAEAKLSAAIEKKTALLHKIYALRAAVGSVNESSGVNTTLTNLAMCVKAIEMIQELGSTVMIPMAEIQGRLEKLKAAEPSYYAKEVESSVLRKADIDNIAVEMASLKKKKQELQDQLLHLNVTTHVEIGDLG